MGEELWNSIDEDQQSLPISSEHIVILDQRLAALEQDEDLLSQLEEMKKDADVQTDVNS